MSIHATARRVVIVAAGSVLIAALAAGIASSGGAAPKPGPILAEDLPANGGAVELVPVRAVTPPGARCDDGAWFANPDLGYGLCVPGGWGFTDLTVPDPLDALERRQLTALRLLSPDAFPWKPGTRPFDAIIEQGIVEIEITLSQQPPARPDCILTGAAGPGAGCTRTLDGLGLPSPAGPITESTIAIPVTAPGLGSSEADATGLLVTLRTSPLSAGKEVDAAWRAIASIVV